MAAAVFHILQVIAEGIHCTGASKPSGSTCDQVWKPRALSVLESRWDLPQFNTRTQDGRGGHVPSLQPPHHLHPRAPQRSSISEMHCSVCKYIQPQKIKPKSLLCIQEVATSIQLCSGQTRAVNPLESLRAGLAARASSLFHPTGTLNQIQVVWIPEQHTVESRV